MEQFDQAPHELVTESVSLKAVWSQAKKYRIFHGLHLNNNLMIAPLDSLMMRSSSIKPTICDKIIIKNKESTFTLIIKNYQLIINEIDKNGHQDCITIIQILPGNQSNKEQDIKQCSLSLKNINISKTQACPREETLNKKQKVTTTKMTINEQISMLQQQLLEQKSKQVQTNQLRRILFDLAKKKQKNGNYQEAIKLLQQQIPICTKFHGKKSNYYGDILYGLGTNYFGLKKIEKALEYFEKSLQLFRDIDDSTNDVARSLNNIGVIYHFNLNNKEKAYDYYLQSLKIMTKLFGQNHLDLADINLNIASIQLAKGQLSKAQIKYNKAIVIYEIIHGKCHYKIGLASFNAALCHFQMGKYNLGLDQFHRTFSIMKSLNLWIHPSNQNSFIKTFKVMVNFILNSLSIPKEALQQCLFVIKDIFQGQIQDAEIKMLQQMLKNRIQDLK